MNRSNLKENLNDSFEKKYDSTAVTLKGNHKVAFSEQIIEKKHTKLFECEENEELNNEVN